MSFILAVVAVGVSAVYHAIKFKGLDSSTMPPQATSLVIPHKPKHDKTDRTGLDAQVRIYAALLDQGAFGESFGSQVAISTAPAIAAFNAFGECIGVANTFWNLDDDNRIENGAHRDFTIRQTAGPGQQIEYLQVYATGAPICIPGITMTMADNTPRAFLGDFGRACGAAWYYSNVALGDDHQPDCFWLDSGVRNDIYTNGEECKWHKKQCTKLKNNCGDCDENDKTLKYQFPSDIRYLPKAMQFTVSTFSRPVEPENGANATLPDLATLCGEDSLTFRHLLNGDFEFRPRLEAYWDPELGVEIPVPTANPSFKTNNVTLFEQGSDLNPGMKRSESAAEAPSHSAQAWNFYVSSAAPEHSALRLCTSITALGPDFYSEHERKFCDMGLPGSGSRNLYDVCDERKISPCWDTATHQLSVWTKKKRSSKTYTHKVEWKTDGLKSIINLLGHMGAMSTASNGTTGLATATIA